MLLYAFTLVLTAMFVISVMKQFVQNKNEKLVKVKVRVEDIHQR
jgi:hypothetical protein